jgi:rare lipoprotein A
MKYLAYLIPLVFIFSTSPSQAQKNKLKVGDSETGIASFYAKSFDGRITANGEKFRSNQLTAAHRTLPFGSVVEVRNISNDKVVQVRINDRGPFVEGRIIDLSISAAESLDFINEGTTEVLITVKKIPKKEEFKMNKARERERDLNAIYTSEYYNFEVERLKPSGSRYGVQIGSFKELVNMMRIADDLKGKYKKDITVKVDRENDEKVYKVAIGSFPSRAKAEQLKQDMIKDYPGAFIVRF